MYCNNNLNYPGYDLNYSGYDPITMWTTNSVPAISVPQLEDNSKELKINIKKHQIKFNFNL